jgi:hypothetical protein
MITAGGGTGSPPTPPMLPVSPPQGATKTHPIPKTPASAFSLFMPAICKLFVSARDIHAWSPRAPCPRRPHAPNSNDALYPNFYGPNHASLSASQDRRIRAAVGGQLIIAPAIAAQTPRSGWGSAVPERPPTCEIASEGLPDWAAHSRSHLDPLALHGGATPTCEQPPSKPHMTEMPSRMAPCPRARHIVSDRGYLPTIGVTSSMLLGREYIPGLRMGSGRSELVPYRLALAAPK